MPPSPARRRAALLALALPALLLANMANPIQEGDRLGEPSASLRDVHVAGERLRVDLRPLEHGGPAAVEAVYRLRNDGAARTLDLVFVADALADSGGVWLNGVPVPAVADTLRLPEGWRAPETTPGVGGREDLLYVETRWGPTGDTLHSDVIRFALPLPPGEHEVRVRYAAEATRQSRGSPAVFWQLAYILAPARQWASFGALDARVELPAGWHAAARPAMRREGDALVARWDGIPADALALTAQSPPPDETWPWVAFWAAAAAALALVLWLATVVGRWLGRGGRSVAWALLPALGLGALWSVAALLGVVSVPSFVQGDLGAQRAWGYGYGLGILGALSLPIVFLFAAILAFAASFRAHRRARPAG